MASVAPLVSTLISTRVCHRILNINFVYLITVIHLSSQVDSMFAFGYLTISPSLLHL